MPQRLAGNLLQHDRRILLFGQPGIGKSTLAAGLARRLAAQGRRCLCLGADPGSPGFGIPGAVCLGQWEDDHWRRLDYRPLCTLDAGRFRLPLVLAVTQLCAHLEQGTLLIDTPGVVRGQAGAELLAGLVRASAADLVLALVRAGRALPLAGELAALGIEVARIEAAPQARRPGKKQRARHRTALWDAWLEGAPEHSFDLDSLALSGTPPPPDVPDAWSGRQVGLLRGGRTTGLGEVVALRGRTLRIRAPAFDGRVDALLVRDARRTADGCLNTATPFGSTTAAFLPPDVLPYRGESEAEGPRPVARLGIADAVLVNGVGGDPLLHLRLRQQRRSLLFDLGTPARLPARIAHQVSDVFISHTHIDHISGFLWLLRSRIGAFPPCRLYGPPGLTDNLEGLIRGIHWDRVGDEGPRFEVTELQGERLVSFRLQAGRSGREVLDERLAADGLLLEEAAFRVRAITLDHGIPVLAFAFEPATRIGVRKEILRQQGWQPGPWLAHLKTALREDRHEAAITLPGGRTTSAGELAETLIEERRGHRLVYATDLADTAANRNRLIPFARGCHTFFCEAAFSETDQQQARRTGHLTTRACGEIACTAQVGQLLPFHFSRRYEGRFDEIYQEIAAVCPRVVVPRVPGYGMGQE